MSAFRLGNAAARCFSPSSVVATGTRRISRAGRVRSSLTASAVTSWSASTCNCMLRGRNSDEPRHMRTLLVLPVAVDGAVEQVDLPAVAVIPGIVAIDVPVAQVVQHLVGDDRSPERRVAVHPL